jgi:hypothetical protein
MQNLPMSSVISIQKVLVLVAVLCACVVSPSTAGTKYMSGEPELSVYISGTNEFSPGDDISIPVVVENSGLNEFKFIDSSIVDRDDLPNTAKFLLVSLQGGDAPLTIKSDPQMVGDLKGGNTVTCTFNARVLSDAPAGTYNLPVALNYTYLQFAEQYGTDSIRYYYKTTNLTLPLSIRIKPEISIDVITVRPEHVNVGTEGYLDLAIKNTGHEDGRKATVKITRNDASPVIPTDSSVYIGDFPAGSTVSCRCKVSVTGDAERSTYPVDVVVVYENRDGDTVTSRSETVGVMVGKKIDFTIVSQPVELHPGNRNVIIINYTNTGDTTVFSAQSRISAVDPFTSNDDISYLGDIEPGETVTATYGVSVDRDATIKEYGLDSEIRYRDALDNSYISDTMKVRVNVTAQTGISAILANPVILGAIIASAIGIVYAAHKLRKRGM